MTAIKSIRDCFLLCKVSLNKPKVQRADNRARAAAARDVREHGGEFANDKKVIGSTPILLYDPDSIKRVLTPYYSFLTYHNDVTREYVGGQGSPKLLSVEVQQEHSQRFYDAYLAWSGMVDQWVNTYADQVDRKRQELGEYFSETDYPDPGKIRHYWQFTCEYMPIPDPTAFPLGKFAEEQRQAMEQQLTGAMQRAADKATESYRRDLREALEEIASQMRTGQRLTTARLERLKRLAGANLNIAGDAVIDSVLTETGTVTSRTERALNSRDECDREAAASKADELARKLAGM